MQISAETRTRTPNAVVRRCFSKQSVSYFSTTRPRRNCSPSCRASVSDQKQQDSASEKRDDPKSSSFSSTQLSRLGCLALANAVALIQPMQCLAEEKHSGLFAIADIDPKTAGLIASILSPTLTLAILLFIFRIPMSWYPNLNFGKFPWSIVVIPTEPVLGPTRKAIPPVGGVDIAPIIWVAVLSFVNEILLGPQGILNLLQRQLTL